MRNFEGQINVEIERWDGGCHLVGELGLCFRVEEEEEQQVGNFLVLKRTHLLDKFSSCHCLIILYRSLNVNHCSV